MKKVIGYIISLTTIFLLAIFFTVLTVDVAIAANDSTSLNLEESSVPEVDVYSAEKIKKVKAIDSFDSERDRPWVTFYDCPKKKKVYTLDCDLQSLSDLVTDYEQAVDRCCEDGNLQPVNTAWNKLYNKCK